MQPLPRARLGDMLVTAGALTEIQLERALEEQKQSYKRLGDILLDSGLVSDDDIAEARALQMEMAYVDLEDCAVPANVVTLVPESLARTYQVVPIAAFGDKLALATFDPMDVEAIDAIQRHVKKRVEPLLASPTRIQKTLDQVYGSMESDDITASIEQAVGSQDRILFEYLLFAV